MNKLFSKLAEDAGIKIVPVIKGSLSSDIECTLENLKKFFELIATECIDQCFTEGDAERIARHFDINIDEEI